MINWEPVEVVAASLASPWLASLLTLWQQLGASHVAAIS
jgi:hypothetical protein